jgi:hypothetical protein
MALGAIGRADHGSMMMLQLLVDEVLRGVLYVGLLCPIRFPEKSG